MKSRDAEKRKMVVTFRAPTKTIFPVPAWNIKSRSGIAGEFGEFGVSPCEIYLLLACFGRRLVR